MDNRSIGVFDSGIGGLTVANEVIKAMPGESIIYFGDTARVPYGSKSKDTITRLSRQMVRFLLSKGVKAVIIACGTVSTNSYDILSTEFEIPIIDMLTSGVKAALETTKNNRIGVIGTEATVQSGLFEEKMRLAKPDVTVYTKACPLFVPLAEEGWTDNSIARQTAEIYLRELVEKGIDCLLLACTHYPLLYDSIRRVVGDIKIINPAEITAKRVKDILEMKQMTSELQSEAAHAFYVSDNPAKFERLCGMILNSKHAAELADIEAF